MFNRHLKARIATLEQELARVKADLSELTELKRTFSKLLGKNHFLRQENDRLRGFGITPAFPVKRHEYPDYTEGEETRRDSV